MAEVGQRLGSGVGRLFPLRNSQSRPVCARESPGSPLAAGRVRQEAARDQREAQPVSESRATQRKPEKVSRGRKSKRQQVNGSLLCAPSLELNASCVVGFVETRESFQTAGPLLQEKLLPGRMTSWTRGAVSILPDTFRSPQQLRALCTVMFILADQGSAGPGRGQRLKRLKLQPDPSTATRNYCSRRGKSSEERPLLYRSRLAYYDVLKVSPSATQSQIKTAYYKQSFIYHPDKNPGNKEATQRFSEISKAYTILGNISLRRKYDRGILNQSDIQSAGRPSSKETTVRSTGSPQKQQRIRRYFQAGGKLMFDFDTFYKAHYGEQLQRERDMRARKEYMEQKQREHLKKCREVKIMQVTVGMLLAMAGLILVSLSRP